MSAVFTGVSVAGWSSLDILTYVWVRLPYFLPQLFLLHSLPEQTTAVWCEYPLVLPPAYTQPRRHSSTHLSAPHTRALVTRICTHTRTPTRTRTRTRTRTHAPSHQPAHARTHTCTHPFYAHTQTLSPRSTELFPTSVRATGFGVLAAVGVAAIAASTHSCTYLHRHTHIRTPAPTNTHSLSLTRAHYTHNTSHTARSCSPRLCEPRGSGSRGCRESGRYCRKQFVRLSGGPHTHSLTRTLSLTHTHTPTHSRSHSHTPIIRSLTHNPSLSVSLSLSARNFSLRLFVPRGSGYSRLWGGWPLSPQTTRSAIWWMPPPRSPFSSPPSS